MFASVCWFTAPPPKEKKKLPPPLLQMFYMIIQRLNEGKWEESENKEKR